MDEKAASAYRFVLLHRHYPDREYLLEQVSAGQFDAFCCF